MDGKAYKTLGDDEVECSMCNGSGKDGEDITHVRLYFVCGYCNGEGKVDWVSSIVKKHQWTVWPKFPNAGFKRGMFAICGQKTLKK